MLVARSNPRHFLLEAMNENVLSVFVDESGRFQHPDRDSRFYILGMVFHDQASVITDAVCEFERGIADLGLDPDAFVFHAGPLIRKEKGYEYFTRNMRGRVYDRMMTFARKVDFAIIASALTRSTSTRHCRLPLRFVSN